MKKALITLVVSLFMFSTAMASKVEWKMVTTWSNSITFQRAAEHFAQVVKDLSNGEFIIKVYPDGAIVPAFQVFDAVRNNVAQMGHDWPGYWKGKDEAFVAFGSVPFGMNSLEYTIWLEHEGMKLAEELYGKFGLVPLMGGNPGQEMGFFTKKPADDMGDLKGMKVRTVGWTADILKKLGINVSPLPGGEIYLALDRGVIDSAEFSTPYATYPLGFQEIAKNVMVPGWHQVSCQNMFIVNKKAWDSLTPQQKAILKIAARETQLWEIANSEYQNAVHVEKYIKNGVKFNRINDKTLKELRQTTKQYLDELKAKHPSVKKVLDSQENFIRLYSAWKNLKKGVSAYPYEEYMKGNMTE